MAAAALTPAEKAAALDSDLQFVLANIGISIEHQAMAYDRQLKSIRMFATMADTRAEVRIRVRLLWAIDPNENGISPGEQVARMAAEIKLVAAWESCRNRAEERDKVEAQRSVANQPITLSHNDFKGRRKVFEQAYHKLEDDEAPGKSYLETLDTRIGDGEFRPERLIEVITEDEDLDDGAPDIQFNKETGTFKSVAKKKTGKVPSTPEELRKVLKTLGYAWVYLRLAHQNRQWLQSMTPDVIRLHIEYVLGKKVLGIESYDENGKVCFKPPWPLVLAFEFRLRKYALEACRDKQITIAQGFIAGRADRDFRDEFLINPLRLNHPRGATANVDAIFGPTASSNPGNDRSSPYDGNSPGGWKGGGKGKGKDKGRKGKDKSKKAGKDRYEDLPYASKFHDKTPDGKSICQRHNHPRLLCQFKQNCRFAHCCSICFDTKHNAPQCPKRL